MIQATVALPIWNSKLIAWLCLESLCNQKTNIKWELLIAEEEKNAFGVEQVAKYAERLEKAGCVSLKYFGLDYKIPLPQKWKMLAEKANENSKAFIFCAADDYYPPTKIQTAVDFINKGHDWVSYNNYLLFNIDTLQHIVYDSMSINRQCGNIIACKTKDARKLPLAYLDKGVDNWLFATIKPKNPYLDRSDNWKQGFATDGMNNISLSRKEYYSKTVQPFFTTDLNIKNILSKESYLRITGNTSHNSPVLNKKKTIKVAIVSAVWKRPEVFELFAKGIKELEKIKGLDLITIISGSEGEKSRNMVEKHGFKYIEIPNSPLAEKVTAPVLEAKKHNVDYIIGMGSDDIISPELMEHYMKLMRQGYDFIGVTDFYFYDTKSKTAAYWGGYREAHRKGHTVGAARAISKNLLDKWNWKPWDNEDSLQLDRSIQYKLKSEIHSSHTFSLREHGFIAVDIKSETNMTPFQLWDNTQYINKELLTSKIPYLCAE